MYQDVLDRILEQLARNAYEEEIKRAHNQYFEHMKEVCVDDPSYERLTQCFLHWYVLDRPMDGQWATPLQIYAQRGNIDEQERTLCNYMASNIHSLFEVLRTEQSRLIIKDLFTLEVLHVSERRKVSGLERSDILEARLYPTSHGKLVFSQGAHLLHPRKVKRVILESVFRSRQKGSPSAQTLIHRLETLTFRFCDRYRERLLPEKIYNELMTLS
jgi:hypothetical protein